MITTIVSLTQRIQGKEPGGDLLAALVRKNRRSMPRRSLKTSYDVYKIKGCDTLVLLVLALSTSMLDTLPNMRSLIGFLAMDRRIPQSNCTLKITRYPYNSPPSSPKLSMEVSPLRKLSGIPIALQVPTISEVRLSKHSYSSQWKPSIPESPQVSLQLPKYSDRSQWV